MADKQEEWKEEYRNKLFFEVFHDAERDRVMFIGPRDDIRYTAVNTYEARHGSGREATPIAFVQIVDGRIAQGFTKDEIIVLDADNNA